MTRRIGLSPSRQGSSGRAETGGRAGPEKGIKRMRRGVAVWRTWVFTGAESEGAGDRGKTKQRSPGRKGRRYHICSTRRSRYDIPGTRYTPTSRLCTTTR